MLFSSRQCHVSAEAERKVMLLSDESQYERERGPLSVRLDRVIDLMHRDGWNVSLVTVRTRWEWHDHLEANGVGAYTLSSGAYSATPVAAMRLARIIRREGPSVVHALGPFCALISGLSHYRAPGPARVYDRSHVSGRARLNIASRVAGATNDHTMARSDAVRRAAEGLDHTDPSNITVVHDGVTPPRPVSESEVSSLRASLGIAPDEPVVGMISRFRPEKGHLTLLEAMPHLSAGLGRTVHLVLVGAGPYESTIREAAERTSGCVSHFVGHQSDVAPWLLLAGVVAIPSYMDAFPKVALEAMAAGRPVVASSVGGLPELVAEGVNGFLVPPSEPMTLASALERVLRSEQLAGKLGDAGRATYLDRYTLEKRHERWIGCYERALQQHPYVTSKRQG